MTAATNLFTYNLHWMGWNLFLAIIPLILSAILFFDSRRNNCDEADQITCKSYQKIGWWLGIGMFILFLPNAAYTITDIIHFVADSRNSEISRNEIIFIIIPQYLIFLIIGFQCHVLSLMNVGQYLHKHHLAKQLVAIELVINLICAFGVYLGRFNRLNSWNILTKPNYLIDHILDNLDELHFFLVTLLFFGVISFFYYLFKWLNLSVWYGWQKKFTGKY